MIQPIGLPGFGTTTTLRLAGMKAVHHLVLFRNPSTTRPAGTCRHAVHAAKRHLRGNMTLPLVTGKQLAEPQCITIPARRRRTTAVQGTPQLTRALCLLLLLSLLRRGQPRAPGSDKAVDRLIKRNGCCLPCLLPLLGPKGRRSRLKTNRMSQSSHGIIQRVGIDPTGAGHVGMARLGIGESRENWPSLRETLCKCTRDFAQKVCILAATRVPRL